MSTVEFEKTKLKYTYFYKVDATSVASGASTTFDVSSAAFVQVFKDQTAPSSSAKVRGREIYIDVTPTNDDPNGVEAVTASTTIVTRMARVTTDSGYVTGSGNYDILVTSDTETDKTKTLATASNITVKNVSGSTADIRLILVVEE